MPAHGQGVARRSQQLWFYAHLCQQIFNGSLGRDVFRWKGLLEPGTRRVLWFYAMPPTGAHPVARLRAWSASGRGLVHSAFPSSCSSPHKGSQQQRSLVCPRLAFQKALPARVPLSLQCWAGAWAHPAAAASRWQTPEDGCWCLSNLRCDVMQAR